MAKAREREETKTRMECNCCGGDELREIPVAYVCPWCGEGVMLPMEEVPSDCHGQEKP